MVAEVAARVFQAGDAEVSATDAMQSATRHIRDVGRNCDMLEAAVRAVLDGTPESMAAWYADYFPKTDVTFEPPSKTQLLSDALTRMPHNSSGIWRTPILACEYRDCKLPAGHTGIHHVVLK